MTDMTELAPVERPNGKLYRPRKIACYPVADANEITAGVCILGTHDLAVAQPLADASVACWIESGYIAIEPETGWFREGYESGRPMWVRDEVRGRAGIMFREVAEKPRGSGQED